METSQAFYTLFIFNISVKLALVCLSLLPIMFIYSFFIIKEVRKRYRATDDSEADMVDDISEVLNSIRVIKAYNSETYEINKFEGKLKDYEGKFKRWKMVSSFFFSSSDIFIFSSGALALIYYFRHISYFLFFYQYDGLATKKYCDFFI